MAPRGVSREFVWKIVVFLLLFGVVLITLEINRGLTAAPPEEDPVGEYYAEVVRPAPWLEKSRLPSPDGLVDAVFVTNGDEPGKRFALFLVPAGRSVPVGTPYRSHVIFLKRLVAQAAFVAVKTENVRLTWNSDKALLVTGDLAVFFGKKPSFDVSLEGRVRTVDLEYEFKESRFSDALGVDWEDL